MLNRLLPNNIRCYSWAHVGSNISSRFDCSWRMYKYYFPKGNLNINVSQNLKGIFIFTFTKFILKLNYFSVDEGFS